MSTVNQIKPNTDKQPAEITFQGGQSMPAFGTPSYNALVTAQNSGTSGAGSYNPSTGSVSVGGTAIYTPPAIPKTISAGAIGSSSSPVALPSALSVQNPGVVNNAGLINSLASSGYTFDTKTNTFIKTPTTDITNVPKTDTQETKQTTHDLLDKINGYNPQRENVLSSPEIVAQNAEVLRQRQAVSDATNQLNSVIVKQNQDLLSLRATGSQEGVTEAVYGGQQATINREAAIRALPIQASIAAAQGSLSLAQDYLKQLTDLKTEQVNNKYDYEVRQYESIKGLLTKSEERTYNEGIKQKENERQDKLDLIKVQNTLLSNAYTNKAPLSVTQAINSATTQQGAIAAAGQYGGDMLGQQYKQAQIDKLNVDNAKTIAETKALGGGEITNPEAAKYATALNTILGSGKFTKEQKADVIKAINNGEDPFSVIKNQAKNIMGQTLATQLDKYETAKSQMQSIDSLLTNYYANGGTTGIFTGNFEKTLNKLGEVNNPALVGIATNIASALQIYRNAVSGTAYSVQEGKDIASIFPGINKSQGLNKAILSGRMGAFDTTIDAQYRNTLGSTYDTLKNDTKGIIDSKSQVIEIGKNRPELQGQIRTLVTQNDPTLGRPLTYDEVLQVLNQK